MRDLLLCYSFLSLLLSMAVPVPVIVPETKVYGHTAYLPGIVVGNPSRPLHVDVQLQEGQATTVAMGPEGGTITAMANDGTRFTLEVPAGALILPDGEPIEITLVPVAEIEGFPFSHGLTGAVQFRPAGLQFLEPATLIVTPAAGYNLDELTAFAYDAQGQNFHMVPVRAFTDTSFQLSVSHFSGMGGGEATEGDRAQQWSREPSKQEQRIDQMTADALTELARRQQQGELDACLHDAQRIAIDSLMREWYVSQVYPFLQRAETDSSVLKEAIEDFMAWWSRLQALRGPFCYNIEDDYADEIYRALASIETGLRNAIAEAHDICVSDSDPYQALEMLQWGAYSQALPQVEDLMPDAVYRQARCLRFELDFESEIWDTGGVQAHVRAEAVPLRMLEGSLAMGYYEGDGALDYVSFVFPDDCPTTIQLQDSTLLVPLLSIDFGKEAPPRHISAYIWPIAPKEQVTIRCPDDPPLSLTSAWWFGGFVMGHQSALDTIIGAYRIQNWDVLYRPDVLARKTYGPRLIDEETTEHTTLILRHSPVE